MPYIVIIDEDYHDRAEEVYTFSSLSTARASVWGYIRRVDPTRDEHDIVDARLYKTGKRGKCTLVDTFSDVALDDGFAEGWKSEGRREAERIAWDNAHRRSLPTLLQAPLQSQP